MCIRDRLLPHLAGGRKRLTPSMGRRSPNMLSLGQRQAVVDDPPIARALFGDTRLSWLWLLVRLYLGYSWITASLHKLADPALSGVPTAPTQKPLRAVPV